ncbi:MAG: hypothetical protein C3F13_09675 [Anaerolineales bacterium]|nr:hypothetical protein [Anaerolineae bacterium]PWB53232.1 MAG: hypothetical protein C3F13_09675 [Anaerolineales bacterium]
MTIDHLTNIQLPLFVYGEAPENIGDLLPVVWNATECLTSADPMTRHHGIDALLELGAQRVSSLVSFMIATCITDNDIYVRRRAVYILADLISKEPGTRQASEIVRMTVINYLHNMSEGTIFGLLELVLMDPQVEKSVYHLFNACPMAGRYLANILTEWKNPLLIRQQAVYFIGLVGYIEVLPVLERLLDRLESRQNGQYSMSFATSPARSEEDILPNLRIAIKQMTSR